MWAIIDVLTMSICCPLTSKGIPPLSNSICLQSFQSLNLFDLFNSISHCNTQVYFINLLQQLCPLNGSLKKIEGILFPLPLCSPPLLFFAPFSRPCLLNQESRGRLSAGPSTSKPAVISSPLLSFHLLSSQLFSSHLLSSQLFSSHLLSSHLLSSPLTPPAFDCVLPHQVIEQAFPLDHHLSRGHWSRLSIPF